MKHVFSILILTGILMQLFGKTIICINYQLNKDYISNVFCENKNSKKLHCNGKCYMKKQLKEEDKKENAPANNLKEKFELQLFSESKSLSELNFFDTYPCQHISSYVASTSTFHLLEVFRPPVC